MFAVKLTNEEKAKPAGFTLAEALIALAAFAIVLGGVLCGYVQANNMAEWSSMSLAAQSLATQGAEQARAADWRPRDWPVSSGPGTMDELPPTNYANLDYLDIPAKGKPGSADSAFWVTNYVNVTTVSANPPLRQIRSDCVWTYPITGRRFTNSVILLRAPDQ